MVFCVDRCIADVSFCCISSVCYLSHHAVVVYLPILVLTIELLLASVVSGIPQ